MLLQNFVKSICGNSQKSETGSGTLSENFLTMGNSVIEKYGSTNQMCLCLGTGNTEPTTEDLALDTDVSTSLTFISGTISKSVGNTIVSISATYKNETGSSVTIKEIGFARTLAAYYSSNVAVFYTRSLLDSPVTMGVGETYTFTYEVAIA